MKSRKKKKGKGTFIRYGSVEQKRTAKHQTKQRQAGNQARKQVYKLKRIQMDEN